MGAGHHVYPYASLAAAPFFPARLGLPGRVYPGALPVVASCEQLNIGT